MTNTTGRPFDERLLSVLKKNLPDLEKIQDRIRNFEVYEEGAYRFYHQSYKVYFLQGYTREISSFFVRLLPGVPMNDWFLKIVEEGTKGIFNDSHNSDWLAHTRPILEAFFHAKYFMEMAVRCAKDLEGVPELLPYEWASLLYLYNAR